MLFFCTFSNIIVLTLVLLAATALQGCHQNRNVTKLVPVSRTRLQTAKGNDLFRKLNPFKKRRVEEYTDFETKMELISECCAGYEMTAEYRCVPSCPSGCQKFATCTLPSKCQCNNGYFEKNSTKNGESISICQPDCSSASCPKNSECVAPNQCECIVNYKRQGSNCVRNCSANCINGECDDDDKCNCYQGYVLGTNGVCIAGELDEEVNTTDLHLISIGQQQTTENYATQENYDDEGELVESSTTDIFVDFICPEGFIQHRGNCRPIIDAEYSICKEKCELNFVCSSNGQCISESDELIHKKSSDFIYWMNVFLISIGSLSILAIIIKLSGRFLVQKGHFEVKGKDYEYDVEYKKTTKEQWDV